MAIRRCPYCKAIIDEGSEYCSNCGTQLIFPEDEFVEEEIPGEKIVDVDEEEIEPQEEPNPKKGKGRSAKSKKAEVEPDDVPDEEDSEGVEANAADQAEESETSFEIEPDEKAVVGPEEAEIKESFEKSEEPEVEEPLEEDQEPEYIEEVSTEELPDEEPLEPGEKISFKTEKEAGGDTGEDTFRDESVDFRTADLEHLVDPAEKEKEEIEKFLDSLKEEREKTKKYYEETGELPPWAQSMREGSTRNVPLNEEEFGIEPIESIEGEEDAGGEEHAAVEEPFGTEEHEETVGPVGDAPAEEKTEGEHVVRPSNTGMGLPEGVDQQNLPFSQGLFGTTIEKEKKSRFKKPEMQFSPWIKSRIFDVLFIFGVWIVTLWLASRVLAISLFKLLTSSTVQTLVFFGILLLIYFFLFLFFLGETLGDHLFSED
jgi:hypothetical protein